MKKYQFIKKLLMFFTFFFILCNVSSNVTYAKEQYVTINGYEYQLNIEKQGDINKCTFLDEKYQEHTVEYFQDTGKLYLGNKIIASSSENQVGATMPRKFYAKSSYA